MTGRALCTTTPASRPTVGHHISAQPVEGRIPGAYTIDTGDCREAVELLKSRGVPFETDVLEFPWGYLAVFRDPDGNRLQLREVLSDA